MGIRRTVAQQQRHFRHARQRLFHASILADQRQYLVFRKRKIHINFLIVGDRQQRSGNGRVDQGPYSIRRHACHSVHRAAYYGIRKVVASIGLGRLGLCQTGFCFQQGIPCRLAVKIRNHLFLEEFLLAVRGQTGRSYRRFRTLHIGHCRLQGCLIGHLVDNKEHLPFLHLGPFLHANVGNRTAHLRTDFHTLPSLYHRRIAVGEKTILFFYGHGLVSALLRSTGRLCTSRQESQQSHKTRSDKNKCFFHLVLFLVDLTHSVVIASANLEA